MTCVACGWRPAPASGRTDRCIVCRGGATKVHAGPRPWKSPQQRAAWARHVAARIKRREA